MGISLLLEKQKQKSTKLKAVQLEILWSGGDPEENRNIKFSALSLLLISFLFSSEHPPSLLFYILIVCLSISHPLSRKEDYAQHYWEPNSKFRKT